MTGSSAVMPAGAPRARISFFAYALAFGTQKIQPAIIGTGLNDPKFKLRIK